MKKNIINSLRNYKWLILGMVFSLSSSLAFSMSKTVVKKTVSSKETSTEKQKRFEDKAELRLSQAAKLKIKAEKIAQANKPQGTTPVNSAPKRVDSKDSNSSVNDREEVKSSKLAIDRQAALAAIDVAKLKDQAEGTLKAGESLGKGWSTGSGVGSIIAAAGSKEAVSSVSKKTDAVDDDKDLQMTEKDVKLPKWVPASHDSQGDGGYWEQVSTKDIKVKELSVGSADHIWAVSDDNKVYQKSDGSWNVRGDGVSVTAAHDGTVYAVHADNSVAQLVDDKWKPVAGVKLSSITAGNKKNVWGILKTKDSHDTYKLNGDKWEPALGIDGKPAQGLKALVVNDDATMLALDADGKVFMRTDDSKKKVERIESTREEVVNKSQKRMTALKQKIAKIKAKPRDERTPQEIRQLKQSRAEVRELKGISDGHKAIKRKGKRNKKGKQSADSSSSKKLLSTTEKAWKQEKSTKIEDMPAKKRTSVANEEADDDLVVPSKKKSVGKNKTTKSSSAEKASSKDDSANEKGMIKKSKNKKKQDLSHEQDDRKNSAKTSNLDLKKASKANVHKSYVSKDKEDSSVVVSNAKKRTSSQNSKKGKKVTSQKVDDVDAQKSKNRNQKKHTKKHGGTSQKSSKSKKSSTVIRRGSGDVDIRAIEKNLYGKK